ncbi:MAG: DNA polymerase III subunit gamma/tau [Patescibacteria group bacterium]|nr:MAG: DNA polymerase III subunit gamma/tau [Patescibacteria group bacterium]
MLYRTYRPQKFSELVGLETVKKTLQSQVKQGKIGHAYLFSGPRGTGKTTTARILAKAVNCKHLKDGEPCGKCNVCRQIQEGRFLDLIEIDAASNRGIDDIRALREKVRLAPSVGEYKVYIVDEAHMLTPEAFNALLKTLEEPPGHAVFVLATTEPHKLPDTIRSRCQRFSFERAPVSLIVEKLKEIAAKEKAKITDEELEQIAKASGGGFRDAETLLEQVLTGGRKVEELTGFAQLSDLGGFFDFLISKQAAEALFFISNLYNQGVKMENLAVAILEYLRDLLLVKVGVGDKLVERSKEQYETLQNQAAKLTTERIDDMINKFTQSYEYIAQAAIPTLPLEVAAVEVAGSAPLVEDSKDSGSKKDRPAEPSSGPKVPKAHQPAGGDDQWSQLMAAVKPLNHSIEALLRSCRLGKVSARTVTIQAFYDFHKERLEDPKSRAILEQAVRQVYGRPLKLKIETVSGKPRTAGR